MKKIILPLLALAPFAGPVTGAAEDDLAQQLANPVSSLVSVPFQSNWDFGIGPSDAARFTLNIQPVIPVSLDDEWNLIVRTILPVIDAEAPAPGIRDASGLGDVVQSFFLSPVDPVNGWIVGAGPVFLYPSATDDLLGTEKWGAGPTAVVLKQAGPWTYGALANHLWSFAGEDSRTEVNATFLQPFVSYITPAKTTFTLNAEATLDWERNQWNVPLNVIVSQLFNVGNQPVQASLGGRYYAEGPDGGPEWGIRAAITLLFPK
ncbi:MAG: transporter [Verrucomicrobiales bacterium]|nr:transporter [Verrucomicrobiales bacterium]